MGKNENLKIGLKSISNIKQGQKRNYCFKLVFRDQDFLWLVLHAAMSGFSISTYFLQGVNTTDANGLFIFARNFEKKNSLKIMDFGKRDLATWF